MGHHNIRYTGDPHAATGVWGYPDSVANFCEEDYAVTSYIAEFINTITNLAYSASLQPHTNRYADTSTVYYALRYCKKTRPGAPWHQKLDFMSLALISVGTCSAAFHGTMRLIPQLFDDMSMFLLAGALLQPIYAQNQPPAVRRLVTAAIVLAIGGVAVVYVRSGDILIHTVAFISMITLMWPRALYLIHRMGRAEAEKRRMMKTFKRSLWTLALGYGLWHVDLELCLKLRAAKEVVGVPLSWVLELHGWWHFLTALGASHFIRLVRMITNDGGEAARKRL